MCKVFRNEIWMCNIKQSSKFVINGEHPCVIISNFKHILKSETINVLVISSNITRRNSKSHVKIDGYNLLKESRILCDMILTVNKSDLMFRIGKIDNVKMQEINSCLMAHLQVDGKFKNLESEDLETIFLKGGNRVDDKRKLNILKSKIKTAYLEEDNGLCLELADRLIEQSKDNQYLWYGYYTKSLIEMRTGNIELALEYAKESIKYVNEVDIFSQDYTLSMWALSRCYSENNKEKAIEIYETLSKVYRELCNDRLRLSCIFNIAKLKGNTKSMKRLISIVENTNTESWYFDIDKNKFLENMKIELSAISI